MRRPLPRTLRTSLLLVLALFASPARPAHAVEERACGLARAVGRLLRPEQALRDVQGYGVRGGFFLNRFAGVEALGHRSAPNVEFPRRGAPRSRTTRRGILLTPDRTRWTLPYVYGGIGMAKVERKDTGASESQSAFHFGGGVIIRLGEWLGFRLDGRDITYTQEIGPGRPTRVNTFLVSGGVTAFFMGRSRDTDSDGVPDKSDRCKETPQGAVVDASGCPLDTDQDLVFDGLDKCPGTPKGAIVDAAGCPTDKDKDGVATASTSATRPRRAWGGRARMRRGQGRRRRLWTGPTSARHAEGRRGRRARLSRGQRQGRHRRRHRRVPATPEGRGERRRAARFTTDSLRSPDAGDWMIGSHRPRLRATTPAAPAEGMARLDSVRWCFAMADGPPSRSEPTWTTSRLRVPRPSPAAGAGRGSLPFPE